MPPRDLIDELLEGRVKATLFGGDRAPRLGRLVILEPIGAGAMGTVFAAYDPRLERKVAVKLLRGGDAEANQRVLAEARSLGKLTHPNVVVVHDADEVDGSVYIVMELAPGPSLRRWIAEDHDWRAAVDMLRQVAVGLAAAHRAGVIHRDVKPDNILVGPDRVRIVDFGLAAPTGEGDGETSAGTPIYMAPEVLAGAAATEKSDQFSFGVTLFEVLYGERPHHGTTRAELEAAARTAADVKRPAKTLVPGWLHAVAIRALAAAPCRRFPSMDAVADELGRDRRRRRRIAVTAAGMLAALAITGALAYRGGGGADRDPCAGGPTRRARVAPAEAIARIEAGLGTAAWASQAATELRGVGDAWEASFRVVCEATRVGGAQSDTLYTLRMRCLDRRLDRLVALTAALTPEVGRPLDADAREQATPAIAALPRPETCVTLTDPGELALPDDPAARARVLAAERDLDRAWAAYSLGHYADAGAQTAVVDTATAGLDAPALRGALELLAGLIEARIGDPAVARARLERALSAAAAAHATDLEVEVWTRLLRGELFAGTPARVVEWEPFARAAAARAGRAGAEIDGIVGEALRDEHELDRAREVLTRALATTDPLRGDQRALIEMNLGSVELELGNPDAAEVAFTRALASATSTLGEGHPGLALYIEKHAAAGRAFGRIARALDDHARALALRRAAFGDDDRSVATSRLRLAQTLIEAGQLAAAERELATALAIRAEVFGADHRRLGEIYLAIGDAAVAAGTMRAALVAYRRAVALDDRLEVGARLGRAGDTVELLAPGVDEPMTIERVATAVEWIRRLRSTDGARARGAAAALRERWRAVGARVAPAISVAVGAAAAAVGDRAGARDAYTTALAALADESSRLRLEALIGLAEVGDGTAARDAAARALELLGTMRELDQAPRARLERLAGPP